MYEECEACYTGADYIEGRGIGADYLEGRIVEGMTYGPPGALIGNCTGTAILWGVGGFIAGCLLTVLFVNISGQTSILGLARKTREYGQRTVSTAKKTWGF